MSLFPADSSAPIRSTFDSIPNRPGWMDRLTAAAFYLCLAPLLRLLRFRRDDPFVQHHAAHALATILALLAVLFGGFLYWLALSYLLVYRRDLYDRLPQGEAWSGPERDVLFFAPVLLSWLLIWLGGLLLALLGSRRSLPLIGRLARRSRLLRLAFAGNAALLAAAALTAVSALHASSLTRDDDEPAAAYLLYDDMGFVPRWVMNLGFYRILLAARARWGPDSVIVAPLDEHHLRPALRHGRFVFLACHGAEGEIITPKIQIKAPPLTETWDSMFRGLYAANVESAYRRSDWSFLASGQDLRFVYNSACDGGSKATEWEQALAPAKVRTFDRLSSVIEHTIWLWSDGPILIREME